VTALVSDESLSFIYSMSLDFIGPTNNTVVYFLWPSMHGIFTIDQCAMNS
jgi:hypothetical protein